MQSKTRGVEVLLLVIAGTASALMSAFGLFAGAWGGFWSGSSMNELLLHFLFWFLPTLSLVAFVSYFRSKAVGLFSSWAISIGSMITIYAVNLKSCLADQCTTTNPIKIALGTFLLPHIWILLIASFTLYRAAVIQKNATSQGLRPAVRERT
jgi:hypothetical protein